MCIKQVSRGDEESRIAQMLGTVELRSDPMNHCVPVIEVIDDPSDDSTSYMVMPLPRNADLPPFQYMKEVVDFVDQILEVGSLSWRKEKERQGGKWGERRGKRRGELWGGWREGWNGWTRATCSIFRCVVCNPSQLTETENVGNCSNGSRRTMF